MNHDMPLTVPCDSDVAMTVTAPLIHLCPYKDEVDHGTVTITWNTQDNTLELHDLASLLHSFSDQKISHEEITRKLKVWLSCLPGIDLISVETTWDTAGMEVRCSTSPTLVGQP